MKLQLLRNATQILKINNKTILIDPMLAPKETYEAFQQTNNSLRNPLVDLPVNRDELALLIAQTDAVLLTHLHLDHWDTTAQQLLPKEITLFCQEVDAERIRENGFTNVQPIADELSWNNIRFSRTDGQHGVGETGKRMGIVSGFVIKHEQESVYIAGDTIWCEEVEMALDKYKPERIVLNGGAARFVMGEPIVMTIDDVLKVCSYAPEAMVYVVHLEAVNHGTESREEIRQAIEKYDLTLRCVVPDDGEYLF
ncbi:MBL fold metallo-hydrolase [Pedobacter sp. PAMC26386]|nr:MBL fold metallo-hydrolase [Pedobacter sp. PAMC26386]